MPGFTLSALLKTLNGEIFSLLEQFTLFSPLGIAFQRCFALSAFSAFITHLAS